MPEADLGSSDSETSAASSSSRSKTHTPVIQAAINAVAERTNYGIDNADIPSSSTDEAATVPAALQLWRWEVKDYANLPIDHLER